MRKIALLAAVGALAGTGVAVADGDKDTNSIRGTSAADTLTGTAGDDRIFGRAGDDTIDGAAGNDYLKGGHGKDALSGGAGDDRINARGDGRTADTISCGEGADKVWAGRNDVVAGDCEVVKRHKAKKAKQDKRGRQDGDRAAKRQNGNAPHDADGKRGKGPKDS